jgi:replicative DNA helicase
MAEDNNYGQDSNKRSDYKDRSQAPQPQSIWHKPRNIEAEQNVLGAMLLDNECIIDVMQTVRPEEFYNPAHQEIYHAITTLYDQHQTVDLTMLVDELRRRSKLDEVGGVMTLANLEQNVLSTGAAPELAKIVSDKSKLRKLMSAAEQILADCSGEVREVEKQIDTAEHRVYQISQETQNASFTPVADIMPGTLEHIGQLYANEKGNDGVPTGFIDLDKYLNGCMHKGELLILAARPSIGKTAFALNIALNVALRGTPVGVFSLEMGKEQLNMRLLCSHAQISGYKVSQGIIKEQEFRKLKEKGSELQQLPLFIDDTPGLTLMALRSQARRLASSQKNLGLIIIDYLQLMSGADNGKRDVNRQQEVSDISRGLKGLARDLQVPVLALSQLSRNIEQRSGKDKAAKPMLSDLRESGAIEQDADVVMFVHRERVEVQKKEDGSTMDMNQPIETEIIVGKHRNGPIGTAHILFWPDFTQFTNLRQE